MAGSLTPVVLSTAERAIAESRRPADPATVATWIGKLAAVSAKRPGSDFTADVMVEELIERLSVYPADVVHQALMIERWKFFPTWAELADKMDELQRPRLLMLLAVKRARDIGIPRSEPERERVTPEAAQRILEENGYTAERLAEPIAKPMPKHWTDGMAADDPRRKSMIEALAKEMQADPLVQGAKRMREARKDG